MLPQPASLPLLADARRHSAVFATPAPPFHSPILRSPLPFSNSPSISSRTRLHLSRLGASLTLNLFSRWSDRTLTQQLTLIRYDSCNLPGSVHLRSKWTPNPQCLL